MSNIKLVALFLAIALVILAVIFEVPFVSGGGGVIFVVALVYSYTVAKREAELLLYAVNNREEEAGGW